MGGSVLLSQTSSSASISPTILKNSLQLHNSFPVVSLSPAANMLRLDTLCVSVQQSNNMHSVQEDRPPSGPPAHVSAWFSESGMLKVLRHTSRLGIKGSGYSNDQAFISNLLLK